MGTGRVAEMLDPHTSVINFHVLQIDFFRRLRRFGYINRTISVRDLLHNSDTQLFTKMCLPGHSLYHFFHLSVSICTNVLEVTLSAA